MLHTLLMIFSTLLSVFKVTKFCHTVQSRTGSLRNLAFIKSTFLAKRDTATDFRSSPSSNFKLKEFKI